MIIKNIDKKVYNSLIDYIFKKCDNILLKKYHNQREVENNKEIKQKLLSLKLSNPSFKELMNYFKEITILEDEIENELYYQKKYYNPYIEEIEEDIYEKLVECFGIITRQGNIDYIIYDTLTEKWINDNKDNIVNTSQTMDHITSYYLKLDKKLKNEVKEKESFYNWCFPYSLEDISFFKKDYCFLSTIAHEELCEIYPENQEEYEYLKSIGIKFLEDKFVKTPKEELYYKNYDILRP